MHLLALSLAACGSAPPTGAVPALPAHARSHAPVPIRGECETTFTPPPLPVPAVFSQVDTGTCHLSHLGQVAVRSEQVINRVGGTQSGERILTAANGDVLRAVHTGTSRPTGPGQVSFAATLTFTGGTGRFAGATGQARAEGTANLITGASTMRIVEGEISYAASDRSGS
jgi:hypothetical protein